MLSAVISEKSLLKLPGVLIQTNQKSKKQLQQTISFPFIFKIYKLNKKSISCSNTKELESPILNATLSSQKSSQPNERVSLHIGKISPNIFVNL